MLIEIIEMITVWDSGQNRLYDCENNLDISWESVEDLFVIQEHIKCLNVRTYKLKDPYVIVSFIIRKTINTLSHNVA